MSWTQICSFFPEITVLVVLLFGFLFFFFSQEGGRTEEKEQEEEMFFVPGTEWQYVYVEQPLLRDAFHCNAFSLLFVWSEFREMICFCFPQG